MSNLTNETTKKETVFSPGDEIIRIRSIEYSNGEKSFLFCSEPVTYKGKKDGCIITTEYGILGIEYSDNNWILVKDIMFFGKETSLSKLEGKFIRRTDSNLLVTETRILNPLMFGTSESKKFNHKNMKENVFLLRATENYLVVIVNERLRILDERYINPNHWEEADFKPKRVYSKFKL